MASQYHRIRRPPRSMPRKAFQKTGRRHRPLVLSAQRVSAAVMPGPYSHVTRRWGTPSSVTREHPQWLHPIPWAEFARCTYPGVSSDRLMLPCAKRALSSCPRRVLRNRFSVRLEQSVPAAAVPGWSSVTAPLSVPCRAYPLQLYPGESRQAVSIILMIMNNLDHRVAQFPQELVTYGGNGQVFSNWAQVRNLIHQLS